MKAVSNEDKTPHASRCSSFQLVAKCIFQEITWGITVSYYFGLFACKSSGATTRKVANYQCQDFKANNHRMRKFNWQHQSSWLPPGPQESFKKLFCCCCCWRSCIVQWEIVAIFGALQNLDFIHRPPKMLIFF